MDKINSDFLRKLTINMDKALPLMGEYWAGAPGMLPNVG